MSFFFLSFFFFFFCFFCFLQHRQNHLAKKDRCLAFFEGCFFPFFLVFTVNVHSNFLFALNANCTNVRTVRGGKK